MKTEKQSGTERDTQRKTKDIEGAIAIKIDIVIIIADIISIVTFRGLPWSTLWHSYPR